MIERFVLPHRATASAEVVNAPGGCSLHSSQDFRQSEGPAISVSQSGEEKVHVIGHDDHSVKMNRLAVVVEAMLQRKCATFWRELSCGLRAEGYEQRPTVFLIVRQARAILVAAERGSRHTSIVGLEPVRSDQPRRLSFNWFPEWNNRVARALLPATAGSICGARFSDQR